MSAPPWLDGLTWYQLHALRASGAPDVAAGTMEPGHGFERLTRWLDHVQALGCGGVLLTPIFASTTHGYDTVDPFTIDPRLGTEDDFTAFVAAARERGLRLLLDGVFNHVGRDFPLFKEVLANPHGPAASWFRLDLGRDDGDGFGYASFEGHHDLVALNHHNPEVLDWAAAVCCHWLDRGVDGWRFDAAYAIPRAFLAALADRIRTRHPDAFLLGEVLHGDYAAVAHETHLDSLTQYELHKAIWSSLADANFFELAWALDRHRRASHETTPFTFVGNHDVTRLMSHIHDPALLGVALAILFTVPGTPGVYYGDEFAWRGVKENRPGGDDAIRPRLPLSSFAADPEQERAFELYSQFIAQRRSRPWLTHADIAVKERSLRRLVYTVSDAQHELAVTLDLDRPPGYSITER